MNQGNPPGPFGRRQQGVARQSALHKFTRLEHLEGSFHCLSDGVLQTDKTVRSATAWSSSLVRRLAHHRAVAALVRRV
jgi:hypothetical protein